MGYGSGGTQSVPRRGSARSVFRWASQREDERDSIPTRRDTDLSH